MRHATVRSALLATAFCLATSATGTPTDDAAKLGDAVEVLHAFTSDEENGIPTQLLERARGIAVIPNVIRGGVIVGGRRGRGVLTVRSESGQWTNPAFITLTGGSIGWQFGAESADVILVFANDRSIHNIEAGKFTLGGDATAVAGPLGRRSTKAVTARSEVYIYVRSRGLFAGAAFEGVRLDIDQQASAAFYAADDRASGVFEPQNFATPQNAQQFLAALSNASSPLGAPPPATVSRSAPREDQGEAIIYPLE